MQQVWKGELRRGKGTSGGERREKNTVARLPPETEGQAKKKEVGENGREKRPKWTTHPSPDPFKSGPT